MNESTNTGAPGDGPEPQEGRSACPICDALASLKSSAFAGHVQAMGKEGLLAVRCALDWCVQKVAPESRKPESTDPEGE